MRAVADLGTCQGYANCVIEADRIFYVDDETEKVVVLVELIADDLVEDARRAAEACPVDAIMLEE
jgi:ferredoxin